jgi:hypothetical protein
VVDVRCFADQDDCSRFAYGLEDGRRVEPVRAAPEHHLPPPPISTAYPPGRDDVEHQRSLDISKWARDDAPVELGSLRVEFRAAKIGIDAEAKIPVLCGQVRRPGAQWTRFAVFSLGAAANPPSPTFQWLQTPKDVGEFCDIKKERLQWYALPDKALN